MLPADLIALPSGQRSTMLRGLPWASDSCSGNREPRGTTPHSTVGCFVGAPVWLHPQGQQSNLWGSTTGNMTVTKKGGRACNNQHGDLGRPISYLQIPSSDPNWWFCSSAEPSWWHTITREFGRVHIYLIQILKMSFGSIWAWLANAQERSWVTAPPTVDSISWLHLTRGTRERYSKVTSFQL